MTAPDGATHSGRLAAAVLAELISRGVRDVVVCPGSRSQALALAAAEAEALGAIRLHVRVDERSAAFFALGVARETGVPAAVIVTSGTAVGNLTPATMEAFHARVPLILLSADRPAELRGVRANQTAWSNWFLADFTRRMVDLPAPDDGTDDDTGSDTGDGIDDYLDSARAFAAEAYDCAVAHLNGPGPAHLNIAFRDPLSGGEGLMARELARGPLALDSVPHPSLAERLELVCCEICGPEPDAVAACSHERAVELERFELGAEGADADGPPCTVVIAGAAAGAEAADFAHAAGLPLLAEPSSGARFGREAIQHWEELLRDPELSAAIERVIVFGHPTLTRAIPALVQRGDVETIVIDPTGPDGPPSGTERFNPGRAVGVFALEAAIAEGYDPAAAKPWLGAWVVRDRELRAARTTLHEPDLDAARATGYRERSSYARAEVAVLREPVTREHLCEALWLATWPHDRLMLAASRLIRVMNRMAAPRNIRVHANRGLAGIDGTVATALGVAAASQASENPAQAAGVTRVLIGDLALLHDAGSLLLPAGGEEVVESQPRIQLFVGNDGGGTIFDSLEAAGTAPHAAFERVMYTPQRAELRALAAAYGWEYARVETRGELDRLLTQPVLGPMLVEVPLAR